MDQSERIERVLVGLDERDLADHAIEAAVRLAHLCGAELELLHAFGFAPGKGGSPRIPTGQALLKEILGDARSTRLEYLNRRFPELGLDHESLERRLQVAAGKPAAVLVAHAGRSGADLLFLGTHRHRGLVDFGGTARAVLARSPCPVWVQAVPARPVRRLLVAVEADPASRPTLGWARRIARLYGSEVTVLHSFAPPELGYGAGDALPEGVTAELRDHDERGFAELMEGFDWQGLAHHRLFADGAPTPSILERARDADLVVLGTHGRSRLAREVLGSVCYGVLRRATCGVLVVPHGEDADAYEEDFA